METNFLTRSLPLPLPCRTPENEFVARLHEVLYRKAFDSRYSVPKLCRDIGMSSSQLHRKLVAQTGQPAMVHIIAMRLERAKQLLVAKPQRLISDIAFECGFEDPDYFSRVFSRRFGASPSKFRGDS